MRPSQGLFRQEVVDAQTAAPLGKVHLATLVSHQVWTLAALSIAAAVVVSLFFNHHTRRRR